MRTLHDTDETLAGQAPADPSPTNACDRASSLAWEVAGCIAGVLLALLSAPAFWR